MKHTLCKNRKYLKYKMNLTKQRESPLVQCKQLQEQYNINAIDYIFADVDGNLKIQFKEKYKGSYYHIF